MADFKIPAKFTVGGQEIKVSYVEKFEKGVLGECCFFGGTITLAEKTNDGEIVCSPTSIQNTFFHELVHCILDTMGEKELSRSEKFVCSFAGFLTEAMRSMEYSKK